MDGEILYIVSSGSLCSNRNKFYITMKVNKGLPCTLNGSKSIVGVGLIRP